MKLTNLIVLILSIGTALSSVRAEETVTPSNATSSLAPLTAAPSTGKVTGVIDIRPTIGDDLRSPYKADVRSENQIDLGYQFSPNIYAGYRQFFYSAAGTNDLEKQSIDDSLIRVKAKNLWTSGNSSLNYEGRLYLPFADANQQAGHNMSIRHYFIAAQKLSDSVTVQLMEVPILHSYSKDGFDKSGTQTANPTFENRVILLGSVKITEKLGLDLPIMFHAKTNRTFAPALNSNRLANRLWIYPELDYAINETYTVGVAYYSDNLMSYDDAGNYQGLDIGAGLGKGAVQAVLQVNL